MPNPMYPPGPWPIERLCQHPAYVVAEATSATASTAKVRLFHGLAELARLVRANPSFYVGGVSLANLSADLAKYPVQEIVGELCRMNIYRLDHVDGQPRLVPVERDKICRGKRQGVRKTQIAFYLPVTLVETLREHADSQGVAFSAVVTKAIEAYLQGVQSNAV
jgi:hypothetical protein